MYSRTINSKSFSVLEKAKNIVKNNTIEDSQNSDKNDIKLSELFGDGFNENDLLVTDKNEIKGKGGSPIRKKSKDSFNQKYINLRDSET